eukprot:gene6935-10662_t
MNLKAGMVSNNSNDAAAERLDSMVDYMQTKDYQKKREPKPEPEAKPLVYIQGPKADDSTVRNMEIAANDPVGEDDEVLLLRARRLSALKQKQQKAKELKEQGHGIYREVNEKEFLPEVTSTQFVAVHFYHSKFARCELMHEKIGIVAHRVVQVKFLKTNAEEAPFFTERLNIIVLPCVILFKDGVAIDRIDGFEGLSHSDSFPTVRLESKICK